MFRKYLAHFSLVLRLNRWILGFSGNGVLKIETLLGS